MRDRKADNLIRRQLWLEQCAWANRWVMTPSELRLWSALKARQLGVQFRREVPLAGRYIVDFCAPSVRLVIEVDGVYHELRPRADAPDAGAGGERDSYIPREVQRDRRGAAARRPPSTPRAAPASGASTAFGGGRKRAAPKGRALDGGGNPIPLSPPLMR